MQQRRRMASIIECQPHLAEDDALRTRDLKLDRVRIFRCLPYDLEPLFLVKRFEHCGSNIPAVGPGRLGKLTLVLWVAKVAMRFRKIVFGDDATVIHQRLRTGPPEEAVPLQRSRAYLFRPNLPRTHHRVYLCKQGFPVFYPLCTSRANQHHVVSRGTPKCVVRRRRSSFCLGDRFGVLLSRCARRCCHFNLESKSFLEGLDQLGFYLAAKRDVNGRIQRALLSRSTDQVIEELFPLRRSFGRRG